MQAIALRYVKTFLTPLYGFSTSIQASAFLSLAETLPAITSFPELVAVLDSLDDHITLRTFIIGHDVTVADWGVWGSLKCAWLTIIMESD